MTLASLALLGARPAHGHGVPALVTTHDGALALLGQPPVGELIDDGFEIATQDPGFGVNLAGAAPPVGTRIGLETLGGLVFWDGSHLVATDAVLTIESPEFDSLGAANTTAVPEYTVAADTAPLTGMTWHRYPGGSFWDAHGYYTLAGPAAAGLYGVPMRLVDLAPGSMLTPSEPFTLPLLYGSMAAEERQAGLDAFAALLTPPLVGDYDSNGVVDADDYARWRANYGRAVTPGAGADGNGDGLIDAADYTVWRDAATTPTAIPEPGAIALIAISLSSVLLPPRNLETS